MDDIRCKDIICNPSSMSSWSPPSPQAFKLNFDGSSRGNLGPPDYGGVCRDSNGKILSMYLGAIGTNSNNFAELEGLIRGFECLVDGGWLPAIIEGDTNILIHMARGLENENTSKKISTS